MSLTALRARSDGGMTSTRMATQATRAIRMGPSAVVTEEARRAVEGDLQAAVRHREAAVAAMPQHLIRRRMTSATSARKSACKGAHSAETYTRAAAARPRRAPRAPRCSWRPLACSSRAAAQRRAAARERISQCDACGAAVDARALSLRSFVVARPLCCGRSSMLLQLYPFQRQRACLWRSMRAVTQRSRGVSPVCSFSTPSCLSLCSRFLVCRAFCSLLAFGAARSRGGVVLCPLCAGCCCGIRRA